MGKAQREMDMASLAKSALHPVQHIHFPIESPSIAGRVTSCLSRRWNLRHQIKRVAAPASSIAARRRNPEDYVFEAADPGGKTKRVRNDSAGSVMGSFTSGVPSCSTYRRSPGRSTATTICSTLSGTCSTLRRKGAGAAISNPSSTTRRRSGK